MWDDSTHRSLRVKNRKGKHKVELGLSLVYSTKVKDSGEGDYQILVRDHGERPKLGVRAFLEKTETCDTCTNTCIYCKKKKLVLTAVLTVNYKNTCTNNWIYYKP